jgi:anti-anti-sigma factor
MYTVPQLRRSLQERTFSPECWVILDLSEIRFLDSAGISELVSLYKRFRHQQTVCLVPPQGPCGAMLARMQITRFFVAFASVAEALHHAAEVELFDAEPSDAPQVV